MVAISPTPSGLPDADNRLMGEFAQITGASAVVPSDASSQGGDSLQSAEVASGDEEDEPIPDILDTRTKHSTVQNPLSKFALVAAGCGALAFMAGFLLIGMTSGPATKTVAVKDPEPALSATKDGVPSDPKELEMAPGDLKTTAALATQDRDLAAINESLKKRKPGTTGAIVPGADTQKVGEVKPIAPAVTSPPVPATDLEPIYQTAPILPAAPEPVMTQPMTPVEPIDGNAEWQRISKMGSYGQVPVSMAVTPAPTAVPATAAASSSPSHAARSAAATPSSTPSLLS